MALKKAIAQGTGVTAEYHRIREIRYRPHSSLECRIESYLDEPARRAGKEPVSEMNVSIPLTGDLEEGIPEGNEIGRAYIRLKLQDTWAGAEDV
jgi:hypothetical protein